MLNVQKNTIENKTVLYSGKNVLDVMSEAKNYNYFLFGILETILKNNTIHKILDFGAGQGCFAKLLRQHYNKTDINCVEIDDEYYLKLKEDGFETYYDINDINYNTKYDLVYSFNVLEHIEDDFKTLVKIKNKLSENGNLILYVPAFQFLYSNFDKKISHKRRYSKKDLIAKIQKAGFEINKMEYVDSLGFLCAIIYKMFVNKDKLNKNTLKIYDRFLFPISRFLDKIGFKYILGKNLLLIAKIKEVKEV
mgnify:CR=1 FL=1